MLNELNVTETPPTVSGAGSTTENPPLSVVRENFNSGTIDALTLAAGTMTVKSLTRQTVDDAGRVVKVERYSDLGNVTYSSSGGVSGGGGTVYTTGYHYNSAGLQFKTISPSNTAYETVFDGLGRVTGEKIGGTTVRTYLYDEYDGSAYPAEGNLTQITEKPDGDSNHDRTTYFIYDWRGRNVGSQNEVQIVFNTLDNLGQTVLSQVYDLSISGLDDSTGNWTVAGSTGLRAQTRNEYDNGGRLKEQIRYSVNPGNGAIKTITIDGSPVDETLKTTFGYDGRGNLVRQTEPGGLTTRFRFDGAGREIFRSVGSVSSPVETVITSYDGNGNPTLVQTNQLSPSDTRSSYIVHWYDEANRLTDTADYGTAFTSRPDTPPGSSSDTRLLTHYSYDQGGNLQYVTDPRNVPTSHAYDALGRLKVRIEDFGTSIARRTEYDYDGKDHIVESRLIQGGSTRTTHYYYGVSSGGTSLIDSGDLLYAIQYPADNSGRIDGRQQNQETFGYNQLGERIYYKDRYGVEHEYEYNLLGQRTLDHITFAPGAVDTSGPDAIKTGYDALGRSYMFTSLKGTTVKNQILRTFDGLGALTDEYQDHAAAVNESTSPHVHYSYSETTSSNHHRLTGISYPNGTAVSYQYAGLGDKISRVSVISQAAGPIESYGYTGLSRITQRARAGAIPDLTVTLDAMGRVQEQKWANGATPVDTFGYTYDRISNILSRNDLSPDSEITPTQIYAYDHLNRLTSFSRGINYPQQSDSDYLSATWTYAADGSPQPAWTYKFPSMQQDSGALYETYNAVRLKSGDGSPFQHTSTFDPWNRLVQDEVKRWRTSGGGSGAWPETSDTVTYAHDALGRLIKIGSQDIYYDAAGNTIQDGDGTYLNAPDGSPMLRDNGGTRLWVQSDAQGYTTSLVNSSGNVVVRFIQDPYGAPEERGANWARGSVLAPQYPFALMRHGGRYDWTGHQYVGTNASDPWSEKRVQPNAAAYWAGVDAYNPHVEAYTESVGWKVLGYGGVILTGGLGGWVGIGYMAAGVTVGAVGGGTINYALGGEFWTGADYGAMVGSFVGGFPGAIRGGANIVRGAGAWTYEESAANIRWLSSGGPFGPATAIAGGGVGAMAMPSERAAMALGGVGGANVNWGGLFGNAVFSIRNSWHDELLSSGAIQPVSDYRAGVLNKPQLHHIASNKIGGQVGQDLRQLFQNARMTLDHHLNKILVAGHQGPHGIAYNLNILRRLTAAVTDLFPGSTQYQWSLRSELKRLAAEINTHGSDLNLLVRFPG